MRIHPVIREGVQVYLVEGHGFVAYGYFLGFLAAIQFLTLFLPSLDPQVWMGPANLLKVSSVAALILMGYLGLRIANQEFVSWRFLPPRRWLRQEEMTVSAFSWAQIGLLCLHTFLFVLISSPLLIWAGAIARASIASVLGILLLLLFYGVTYGVWAIAAIAIWERAIETRQVFIRILFIGAVFLSALLYLPLSPIALILASLERKEMAPLVLWGWKASGVGIHFLFHGFLLGSGLLVQRWALKKEVAE